MRDSTATSPTRGEVRYAAGCTSPLVGEVAANIADAMLRQVGGAD